MAECGRDDDLCPCSCADTADCPKGQQARPSGRNDGPVSMSDEDEE